MRKEGVILEDGIDLAFVGRQRGYILAVQQHSAAIGLFEAGQDAKQRGLSAAAGTQEGKEFPLADGERDIVRGPRCPEILGEVFKNQKICQPSSSPLGLIVEWKGSLKGAKILSKRRSV